MSKISPCLYRLWDGLLAGGGQVERCGWLKDRYGS